MNKQEHYLLKIMEECTEVGQRASKAIQFGMEEIQQGQPLTNRERLIQEINNLVCVVEVALESDINDMIDLEALKAKYLKVEKYRDYQEKINQKMKWISVNDELPDFDETVLWTREDGYSFVADIDHDNDWENFKKLYGKNFDGSYTEITHWSKITSPQQ